MDVCEGMHDSQARAFSNLISETEVLSSELTARAFVAPTTLTRWGGSGGQARICAGGEECLFTNLTKGMQHRSKEAEAGGWGQGRA